MFNWWKRWKLALHQAEFERGKQWAYGEYFSENLTLSEISAYAYAMDSAFDGGIKEALSILYKLSLPDRFEDHDFT